MRSFGAKQRTALDLAAARRPREIEAPTNLYIVHPASAAMVPALYRLGISPNAVSVLGAVFAALGAGCFVVAPWPWSAALGFVCLVVRHIFDGADGLLARASGRESMMGDMVDGVCDAVSLVVVYAALGWILYEIIGPPAVVLALLAFASYVAQVNVYEGQRRFYVKYLHGREITTERFDRGRAAEPAETSRNRLVWILKYVYSFYHSLISHDHLTVRRIMKDSMAAGGLRRDRARDIYKTFKKPVVSGFGWLGENNKTIATGISMAFGSPLYLFIYLIVVGNAYLLILFIWQRKVGDRLCRALEEAQDGWDAGKP